MTSETVIKINETNETTPKTYGNYWIWGLLILIVIGVGIGLAVSLGSKDNNSTTANINGFSVTYQNGTLLENYDAPLRLATQSWNSILNEPNDIPIEIKEETISSDILAKNVFTLYADLPSFDILYISSWISDKLIKIRDGYIFVSSIPSADLVVSYIPGQVSEVNVVSLMISLNHTKSP